MMASPIGKSVVSENSQEISCSPYYYHNADLMVPILCRYRNAHLLCVKLLYEWLSLDASVKYSHTNSRRRPSTWYRTYFEIRSMPTLHALNIPRFWMSPSPSIWKWSGLFYHSLIPQPVMRKDEFQSRSGKIISMTPFFLRFVPQTKISAWGHREPQILVVMRKGGTIHDCSDGLGVCIEKRIHANNLWRNVGISTWFLIVIHVKPRNRHFEWWLLVQK